MIKTSLIMPIAPPPAIGELSITLNDSLLSGLTFSWPPSLLKAPVFSGRLPLFEVLAAIVRVNSFFALSTEFSAFTVNVNVPGAVGLPLSLPFVLRVRPPGNVPAETLYVIVAVPSALIVAVYFVPSLPSLRASSLNTGPDKTFSFRVLFAVLPALAALTFTLNFPYAVGVP